MDTSVMKKLISKDTLDYILRNIAYGFVAWASIGASYFFIDKKGLSKLLGYIFFILFLVYFGGENLRKNNNEFGKYTSLIGSIIFIGTAMLLGYLIGTKFTIKR